MNYEISGSFPKPSEVPRLAEFAARWLEVLFRSASEKDWALYRIEVTNLARGFGVELGPFEPFPNCQMESPPRLVQKEKSIRIRLTTSAEEDVDAMEDLLEALGATQVEVAEEVDPRDLAG